MKLKKVAALCGGSKIFRLYDKVDADGVAEQWLGDAAAAYPLRGLPYLDGPGLYRMFDVPEKTQGKLFFCQEPWPEGVCVDDFVRGELPAEDMGVTISWGGTVLLPLRYREGILYIQQKYLGPLEDQADYLKLFVRRTENGGRYVAAKTGMMIAGVIFPYDTVYEGFVERLDEIAALSRRELEKRRAGAAVPRDGAQTGLFGENGEGENGEA